MLIFYSGSNHTGVVPWTKADQILQNSVPAPHELFGYRVKLDASGKLLAITIPGWSEQATLGQVQVYHTVPSHAATMLYRLVGDEEGSQFGLDVEFVQHQGRTMLAVSAPAAGKSPSLRAGRFKFRTQMELGVDDDNDDALSNTQNRGWSRGNVHLFDLVPSLGGGVTLTRAQTSSTSSSILFQGRSDGSRFGWRLIADPVRAGLWVSQPWSNGERGTIWFVSLDKKEKDVLCFEASGTERLGSNIHRIGRGIHSTA